MKEYYFYLDSTPTHSYMKYLYKYPQAAFPYDDLVTANRDRTRDELEYELLDTGVFEDDRYFDVFVEYAKESPEDILIKMTVCNRGEEAAFLHVLPTLWFRNTWSWSEGAAKPSLEHTADPSGLSVITVSHPELGVRYMSCEGEVPLLFTENETNMERLFHQANRSPYVKDDINQYLVHGQQGAVNPLQTGTKAAAHYHVRVGGGEANVIRLRLSTAPPQTDVGGARSVAFGQRFDEVMNERLREADEFYHAVTPPSVGQDERNVMRQALSGMLWSKQYYYFDVEQWVREHGVNTAGAAKSLHIRNHQWLHMVNDDVISMPDKWEYPWYAAWDLAWRQEYHMTGWPPRRTPLTYRSMKKERLTFILDQQPRNRGIAPSVSHIALVFLFVAITHLRTVKNEEIVVPNSLILNSHVINYTTLARSRGLILHTAVGIGYEVPWRQVEAILSMAAERTPGLLSKPQAFVLQKALGDFAVTYELNVYSDDPQAMPQLYTALHQNILDLFNEHGIQIMTPAYEGDPDRPKVVPKDQWFAAPAKNPALTTTGSEGRCATDPAEA